MKSFTEFMSESKRTLQRDIRLGAKIDKSKFISNKDGSPMVFYHGSHKKFDEFDAPSESRRALHFTDDYSGAESYAKLRAKTFGTPHGYVHKVYLKVSKALHTDQTNDYRQDIHYIKTKAKSHDAVIGPAHDGPNPPTNVVVIRSNQVVHLGHDEVSGPWHNWP
jgi:hypothetical protein